MQIQKTDLNKNWQFRKQGGKQWLPAEIPGSVHTDLLNNKKIEDPFYRTNEKKLQWIDKENWEYHSHFKISQRILKNRNHRLVFEGLDTYAEVYLNGTKILDADNMFRNWSAEVGNLLKESNEIRVIFRSPVKADLPKLKALGYKLPAVNDLSEIGGLGDKHISVFARKAPYHYGWDWGPRFVTMGIWRPVYILSWNEVFVASVQYRQLEVNKKLARIAARIEINAGSDQQLNMIICDEDGDRIFTEQTIFLKKGKQAVNISFEIKNPKLWWCNGLGDPYIYTFNLQLFSGNNLISRVTKKIGLRRIEVIQNRDDQGRSFYFKLNGKAVFAKGANYIPNDSFLTRVSSEKYEHIIRSAAEAHMNMIRVWGGGIYENDIFYDLCDRYGVMVWQDFMFACSMYPGDKHFLENIRQEITDNIKRLRHHACIAIWCGNNENDMIWHLPNENGWKNQYDVKTAAKMWTDYEKVFYEMIPGILKEYDPERFYWPSSPLAGYNERASFTTTSGDMHYWGVWHDKEPFCKYKEHPARFMSEFGFQSFPGFASVKQYTRQEDWDINSAVMTAHQRSGIGNQRIKMYMEREYKLPDTFADILYLSHVLQAEGIKTGIEAHRRNKPYCMGSLYWQINDCWPVASWSSIDYYGRWKALHYFAKKAFTPVLISPDLDGGRVRLFLISDLPRAVKTLVRIELMDFNGRSIHKNEFDISVTDKKSLCIQDESLNNMLRGREANDILLYCECYEQDKLLSENILYFKAVKELNLPAPEIEMNIKKIKNGYQILLRSATLAKNVYLNIENMDGFFSDNYFDLLPGREKSIIFNVDKKIDDFKDRLTMRTVYDIYNFPES